MLRRVLRCREAGSQGVPPRLSMRYVDPLNAGSWIEQPFDLRNLIASCERATADAMTLLANTFVVVAHHEVRDELEFHRSRPVFLVPDRPLDERV